MTDQATRARAAAVHCEAKKDRLTQGQSGDWRITFTVSPLDMPQSLMAARPGTRYMLALVEVGDDEQPIAHSGPLVKEETPNSLPPEQQAPPQASGAGRAASSQDKVVQRAVLLCKDPEFHRWFLPAHGYLCSKEESPDFVAEIMRDHLGIASRRDLAIDNDARRRFEALEDEYLVATGRRAWRRPDERRAG